MTSPSSGARAGRGGSYRNARANPLSSWRAFLRRVRGGARQSAPVGLAARRNHPTLKTEMDLDFRMHAERTPNPNSIKWVLGRPLVEGGASAHFTTRPAA